jgi:uncharacterized secreted repeat protein (TIGR03808 family)
MDINRRHLLAAAATGTAGLSLSAAAAPLSRFGLDAAHFGVRPGADADQSPALQRAIDEAAKTRTPLTLAPGVYRAGDLKLPAGSQLSGLRGGTRLVLTQSPSLLSAEHADTVTLSGLLLDGGKHPAQEGRGLVHFVDAKAMRISDCEIVEAGANGITLLGCDGEVTHTKITGAGDNALFSNDSGGLLIAFNTIAKSGNGGIRVWQSSKRRDGSLIADNRIEETSARGGGDGQNGNAINVFRAADVIVRGNHIRKAAFTAIRGNAASNIQILGNSCAGLDEVAIYCEFDFEGAVIADNAVDGAAFGVSVTNFKEGGRLAVVKGNLIRNLTQRRPQGGPDAAGVGIGVEADTAVTGNVIENAQTAGIIAGWGHYLRDVTISGNVVRKCGIGVGVSVAEGAGTAVVAGNMLSASRRGAIVGMDFHKAATGDLALAGAERYPNLRISGNQVS